MAAGALPGCSSGLEPQLLGVGPRGSRPEGPLAGVSRPALRGEDSGPIRPLGLAACGLRARRPLALQERAIITPNVVGFALSLMYVAVYLKACSVGARSSENHIKSLELQRDALTQTGVVALLSFLAVIFWVRGETERVGVLACGCNVVMMAAPILKMGEVLREGETESLGNCIFCGLTRNRWGYFSLP